MIKKWLYKLRYLLLILSSVLGLLWLSSSFGWYTRPIGVYWYNPYAQSFDINLTRAWNPLTQVLWYTKQVFVLNQYDWYWWELNFVAWWRWQKWLPYIYSRYIRSFDGRWSVAQWYIKSYFVCSELLWSETTMPGNCNSFNVWSDTSTVFWTFLKSLSTWDYYYFDYEVRHVNSLESHGSFCVSSSFYWYSLCFSLDSAADLSDSLWLENLDFDSLSSSLLYNPPNSPSWWWGWWAIWWGGYWWDSNRTVFDVYWELWYYRWLCYSDFALNNLATLSGWIDQFYYTDIEEDWIYYTWATVIDLYNYYWSWQSFAQWFNYWFVNYRKALNMSSSWLNPASNYVWRSKWLFTIADKYYHAWFWTTFELYDQYYNYCSYFLNIWDWDWEEDYDWPPLPDSVINIIGVWNFYQTWALSFLSWESKNFDAKSFFDSLTSRFNSLLLDESLWSLNIIWIIPPYILMVLIALLFIRMISH